MKKIGKYSIVGLLGKGGMGRVYKVRHPLTGRVTALKLLDPHPSLEKLLGRDTLRHMFLSEAKIMANLRHPNILGIWDVDQWKDKLFYIMDYYCHNLGEMIGETYRTENPSRIISPDRVIHYIRQIIRGLARLHFAGIIHRDIKPFNILITEYDTVKICDFGLSRRRGERFQGPRHLKVGSPWYAAPEQEADADAADFRSDLYAVGVMMYRMLTGILPTDNETPPSRLNADLDSAWDQFILKAISIRPDDRFTSAREMEQALESLNRHWQQEKQRICGLPTHFSDNETSVSVQPRRRPLKTTRKTARQVFGLNTLWEPRTYLTHRFQDLGNGTVRDDTTGLVWQQTGSEYPLDWESGQAYIRQLNTDDFAGISTWRCPTVDELISLLSETPSGQDFCLSPVFDPRQKWLWSADRRSWRSAWYVSADIGFVGWHDFSGYYYVRAVA